MKAGPINDWINAARNQLNGGIGKALADKWPQIWQAVVAPRADATLDAAIAEKARASAPVVWLIGKVQSGKSSIVRTLTGASAPEVGTGYRACTRTARVFDFPAEAPVIRFLDTRGLGEAAYDPGEDIAFGEGQAHLILAVMRALDPDQGAVLEAINAARQRHPGWPVVVAQTSLHEAYRPGQGHALPYPFVDGPDIATADTVPVDLVRSLRYQRDLFGNLPGHGLVTFAAIDFTLDDDGFTPADYGRAALVSRLEVAAPAGFADALASPHAALERQADPHIIGYATAAAAADVVPLAGAVAVPAIQAKMLHSLALIYDVSWDQKLFGEFGACLGASTATQIAAGFGLRQLAKLIPVYGQSIGAAAAAATSFATTVALGKAAVFFLKRRKAGISDPDGVARAYREALKQTLLSQGTRRETGQAGGTTS